MWAEEEERISQVDRGVERSMHWWHRYADCMRRSLAVFSCAQRRGIRAVQHCSVLFLLLFFFKHEKSQGGVRETTQPRQKQCLGSSSVLILLPQNPVQSKAMDSTDFVVLGDDHDRECLMFSYYWCASVLRVFLSSCIHCFLCFHQWHW